MKKFLSFEFKLLFYEIIIPVPNIEDVLRFFFLKKNIKTNHIETTYLLVVNRLVGVCVLLMFLIFTFFNGKAFLKDIFTLSWFSTIISFALIGFLVIVSIFHKWLFQKFKSNKYYKLLSESIHNTPVSNSRISYSLLLSFLQMLFWAVAIYFILLSVGIHAGLMFCLSIVPLMVISFIVPLSYQGLGLPETVLILYGSLFFDESTLILAAAFHLLFYLIIITMGAIIYIGDKKLFKP